MRKFLWTAPVIGLALAGCNSAHTPIVAFVADDVGVVASASPQNQGASLTVGYKGAKFAVLPVENQQGKLLGMDPPTGQETYSIFAQLGLEGRREHREGLQSSRCS